MGFFRESQEKPMKVLMSNDHANVDSKNNAWKPKISKINNFRNLKLPTL